MVKFRLESGVVPSGVESVLLESNDIGVKMGSISHIQTPELLLGLDLRISDAEHLTEFRREIIPSMEGLISGIVLEKGRVMV